jgi:hypothetical protein
MLRAGVPEAAIEEDGDLQPGKDDVRPDEPTVSAYRGVLAEAEAPAV